MLWFNRLFDTNPHFSSFLDENKNIIKTSQSEIPSNFPEGLLNDLSLLHEEKQWRRSVSTPGSLVTHREEGWTGKVIELRGDPVNGGKVLVEHQMPSGVDQGATVQRFYSALDLGPTMKAISPFHRASNWLSQMVKISMIDLSQWDAHYPRAGAIVSGLKVASESIPNIESISASMTDWHELSGLREVLMSEFGSAAPHDNFYAANDIQRSRGLAEEIRNSGSITPLIVGIDNEGPYILEGGHRFVALGELGIASFPALIIVELDE